MTNKEKYKQAFSALSVSDDLILEVERMKQTRKHPRLKTLVVAAAVCTMLVGSAVAYAADVGGIQRTVQLWIHGDQTTATIQFDGSSYTGSYVDGQGQQQSFGGGGVAFEGDGTQRPLTQEELMEQLTAPMVLYEEDGAVRVYWFDQVLDITDKFEDGICYVKLDDGRKILYLTVKYDNGYAYSPHNYVQPWEFN